MIPTHNPKSKLGEIIFIGTIIIIVFLGGIVFAVTKYVKNFSEFIYEFDESGILHETVDEHKSVNSYWWLSSGGEFLIENGIGKTMQGESSQNSYWRKIYSKTNPRDTDDGKYPQNIFRLLTKKTWQNVEQKLYIYIAKINESESEYRNESNGAHLINRYIDSDNLYYTGIRVDGTAVIKKKKNGVYYTMASNPFFKKITKSYDRDSNYNLLPLHIWIGIRSEIKTNTDGTVSIKMYIDKEKSGEWSLVAEAIDDGITYGGSAIIKNGRGGIRTDFLDAFFDDYKIGKLKEKT